jgi:hypothetical protein
MSTGSARGGDSRLRLAVQYRAAIRNSGSAFAVA